MKDFITFDSEPVVAGESKIEESLKNLCDESTQLEDSSGSLVFIVRTVCFVIALISLVCLLSVIQTMVMNPKLQQHPSSLIGSICVFEGILVWLSYIECVEIGPIYFNCYSKAHEFLSFTPRPFLQDFDKVRAFWWIIYFNQVLIKTC